MLSAGEWLPFSSGWFFPNHWCDTKTEWKEGLHSTSKPLLCPTSSNKLKTAECRQVMRTNSPAPPALQNDVIFRLTGIVTIPTT